MGPCSAARLGQGWCQDGCRAIYQVPGTWGHVELANLPQIIAKTPRIAQIDAETRSALRACGALRAQLAHTDSVAPGDGLAASA
jgi:hypothetical protein